MRFGTVCPRNAVYQDARYLRWRGQMRLSGN
ncbi:Hypothetical Protein XCAW_04408 [Xanthomonas citri subsp. citri Aw12879]|nr:Hypothetical Protein XCAW_04408 [Xanthomonas citri subsp. citri Aw12879]